MSYLVRSRSGPFSLAEASTLESLAAGLVPLLPPAAALGEMPRLVVGGDAAVRLRHGVNPSLRSPHPDGTVVALVDTDGELLALAESVQQGVKLRKVFA